MKTLSSVAAVVAATLCVGVAGCAGNSALEQQTQSSVTRAEASVDRAQQGDVQRHASREVNLARDKLEQARDARERGDFERAERLAVEADLDAQLATAVAANEETQAAVVELRDSLETLREEIQRGER